MRPYDPSDPYFEGSVLFIALGIIAMLGIPVSVIGVLIFLLGLFLLIEALWKIKGGLKLE